MENAIPPPKKRGAPGFVPGAAIPKAGFVAGKQSFA